MEVSEIKRSIKRLIVSIKSNSNRNPFKLVKEYIWYFKTFRDYLIAEKKSKRSFHFELYPCLFERTDYTYVDPVYFIQDAWAVEKIRELAPKFLVDVGSPIKTISIVSRFVKTVFVDIRPPDICLPNLIYLKGSITDLPFKDNSIEFLSSLCVVEHIGLGRYGDDIDVFGTEKALDELKRVLRPGGYLILSLHVDRENKIYFNAHRAFKRDYLLSLIDGFDIEEEKYIYGKKLVNTYQDDFGTVLILLRKV